jgi:hypothetical protein
MNGPQFPAQEGPTHLWKFGRGLVFTDSISQAARDCSSSDYAWLLLSEVALGNMRKCFKPQ